MIPSKPASIALALLWLTACAPVVPTPTVASTRAPTTAETTPAAATGAPMSRLSIVPPESNEVVLYGLLELDLRTDVAVGNPYDPDELDLRVEFTSPSGAVVDVGAFWHQEFDPQAGIPAGDPGWRVRFTPTETGAWTGVARIPAHGLQSEAIAFDVVPSERPGFVRIHPENPRYFAFDNGDFFFPIGLNIGWWSGAGNALTDYRKWMSPFAANGGDVIRVWMADWSFAIEGLDTRLGNYDRRLKRAYWLDQIFDMAEELDLYVILVLLNCADYNNWQTDGWDVNPYNAALGGPLERPDEFVTDPEARAFLQRKVNYVVNRWSYSPRLLAWEWWNEVNLAPFTDETLMPWLEEMTAYLRERDVNRHLTTNSYAIRDLSPIWSLPEIDVIQKHEYSDQTGAVDRDLAERVVPDLERLAASAPAKPILLGEFGYGGEDRGEVSDRTGIHLHNGIWATTFAGYAGSGMYWFWDIYVETYHLWYHFRGLDRFLADIDLAAYQPFSPLPITGPNGAEAVGLGLRGEDVLVWLRSEAYTMQAAEAAHPGPYVPPLVTGQTLLLDRMRDGEHTVNWFDPQTGKWLEPVLVTAESGRLSVSVPDLRRDLAARIVWMGP